MTRAISILLIAAIALQTVGCSTWQPQVRVNEASEEIDQTSMRERVLDKLKEGTRVRISVRAGTPAPITGRAFECIIEKIGHSSLTLAPFTSFARRNHGREFTLRYADIATIEYRGVARKSLVFAGGLSTGVILGFLVAGIAFRMGSD